MSSLWQPSNRLTQVGRLLLVGAAALLVGSSTTRAAVTITGDPDYPAFPSVYTLNPEDFGPASRGITETRELRQTFTNLSTFDVGEIVLSLDVNDVVGGLSVEFFEVDDVLAATWAPGNLVASFSFDSSTLVTSSQRVGITLTDSDIFSLPARTAPAGYGVQLSNLDDLTNIGVVRHSNDGVDHYVDGVFYAEGGTPPASYRDLGVALVDANAGEAVSGDVDGNGIVDIEDLNTILANFRQGAAIRATGDLTGDGMVDLFDFREWKAHFPGALSESFDLSALSAQVPEPATLLSAVLMAGIALAYRRSRQDC